MTQRYLYLPKEIFTSAPGFQMMKKITQTLEEVGELEASIAVHRKAVNLAPEDIGALNNMGTSEQSSGMLDEAIRTFERALELDRSAVITKINLATVLMERNDIDRAIPLFEEVVETASFGDETPEHALAHKNLGLSLMLKS